MTDKEQIMINGVDVSDCNYIIAYDPPKEQGTWGGAIHKGACRIYSKDCKYNSNCYFKQLARKTQECEELKEQDYKNLKIIHSDFNQIKSLRAENTRYSKALEEIEAETKINCEEICGRKFADCNDTSCFSAELLNIINKAKGDNND